MQVYILMQIEFLILAVAYHCTEKTILLKDVKFQLDTDQRSNFVELSK